jgi:hypothetical protein
LNDSGDPNQGNNITFRLDFQPSGAIFSGVVPLGVKKLSDLPYERFRRRLRIGGYDSVESSELPVSQGLRKRYEIFLREDYRPVFFGRRNPWRFGSGGFRKFFRENPGRSGERFPYSGTVSVLEQGEQFVTDPVTQYRRVAVRNVFMERDTFFPKKIKDIPFRDSEERPYDVTVSWAHGGESFGTGSPKQSYEKRFGLIVFGVCCRYGIEGFPFPDFLEESVSYVPERFFISFSVCGGM